MHTFKTFYSSEPRVQKKRNLRPLKISGLNSKSSFMSHFLQHWKASFEFDFVREFSLQDSDPEFFFLKPKVNFAICIGGRRREAGEDGQINPRQIAQRRHVDPQFVT